MKTSLSRHVEPQIEVERINEKEKLLQKIKSYYERIKKQARIKIKLDERTWAWVTPGKEHTTRKKYEGKLYGTLYGMGKKKKIVLK